MENRYTVSIVHGEHATLYHVVDAGAPEGEQPDIVLSLHNKPHAQAMAEELNKQAARIRELEGALARAVRFVEGYRAMHDGSAQDANPGARCACWHCHNSRGIGNSFGSTRPEDARRILAEGSVTP